MKTNGEDRYTDAKGWKEISKPCFGAQFRHLEAVSGYIWAATTTGVVFRGIIP